jgi:hypothetical protein
MTMPTSQSPCPWIPKESLPPIQIGSDTMFFAVTSTVSGVVFVDCLGWLGQQSAKQPVFLSVI